MRRPDPVQVNLALLPSPPVVAAFADPVTSAMFSGIASVRRVPCPWNV